MFLRLKQKRGHDSELFQLKEDTKSYVLGELPTVQESKKLESDCEDTGREKAAEAAEADDVDVDNIGSLAVLHQELEKHDEVVAEVAADPGADTPINESTRSVGC